MKKLVLLVAMGLLISVSGYAQKSNRTKAYLYYEKGLLNKAKQAIDEAVKNEKTKNDPKTWLYYGEIYYGIATSPLPEFKKLDSTAAEKALNGLKMAEKLDSKGRIAKDAKKFMGKLSAVFYQKGANDFKLKKYLSAANDFVTAYNVAKMLGKVDTTAAYNAGISSYFGKDPKLAAEYFKISIDDGNDAPNAYIYYSRSLKEQGDTTAALSVLNQAREKHPQELSLLLEQAQIYLEKGESLKLINSLKEAIAKNPNSPNNANLYFLIGKSYDDLKNVEKAEEYYKKAIDINPKFFAAYYNIGAIYINKAAKLQKEANSLPLNAVKEYNKLNNEANVYLKTALPWLEKAHSVNPADKPTINALREAYTRLKMNDKLKSLMNE